MWSRVTALLCNMSDSELLALERNILQKRDADRLASVAGGVDSGSQERE